MIEEKRFGKLEERNLDYKRHFIMKKIYILHGWTYSLEKWSAFEKLLKREGFDPIFLKIPGLTSESNEVWDLDKYSNWLEKELSKEKDKVILLGHSNGGRSAAYFVSNIQRKLRPYVN